MENSLEIPRNLRNSETVYIKYIFSVFYSIDIYPSETVWKAYHKTVLEAIAITSFNIL